MAELASAGRHRDPDDWTCEGCGENFHGRPEHVRIGLGGRVLSYCSDRCLDTGKEQPGRSP